MDNENINTNQGGNVPPTQSGETQPVENGITPISGPTSMDSNDLSNFDLNSKGGIEDVLLTPNVEGKDQAVADIKKSLEEEQGDLTTKINGQRLEKQRLESIRKDYETKANRPYTGIPINNRESSLQESINEFTKKEAKVVEELRYLENNLDFMKTNIESIINQLSSVKEKREENGTTSPIPQNS